MNLAALPKSGPAYQRVVALADSSAQLDPGDISCPNSDVLLAEAITGRASEAHAHAAAALNLLTASDNSLAAGRCLAPIAIALNLIGDHSLDGQLRTHRDIVYANFGSIVYPGGAAKKANNHGSASDMSVVAIDLHLGDRTHLEQKVIPVIRQRLGEAMGIALNFGDGCFPPSGPVVVGRTFDKCGTLSSDGILIEEQRRAGNNPPWNCGNYNFGASGQFLIEAKLLKVAGYPVASWGENGFERIFAAFDRLNCATDGDDRWQGHLVFNMYGQLYVPKGVGDGKSLCCTDYLWP